MQVRRMLRATGAVVVAGLSYSTAAYADSVIIGSVVNADNKKPVADVVVTATSPNLQGEQVVVTDAQGQYRIPQLPPGVYTLRFDKESFRPFSRSEVQLRLDRTIRVNVELLPEGFTEEIVLTGTPPTIDVGSTSTGVNVDQDFIKRIAVNRPGGKGGGARSFESLAELAPGAQSDSYGVSINGTTSPENGYVVDGLSTNDPAFGVNASPLSVEFVQDVNIITGGYMPEYGRSTGGVINAVTKSGSNEFHGSIYGTVTPGFAEGPRATVRQAASVVAGQNALNFLGDVGATLGGPILKDKLWFFAGVAPSYTSYTHTRTLNRLLIERDASGAPVLDAKGNPTVLTDERGFERTELIPNSSSQYGVRAQSVQYLGKLTYLLNQDHNVSVSIAGTPSSSGGRGVFAIDPQSGLLPERFNGKPGSAAFANIQELTSTTSAALKYAGAFNDKNVLVDANLGWFHQTSASLPSDGSRPGDSTGAAGLALVWYRQPRPISFYEPEIPNIAALCEDGKGGTVACPASNSSSNYYSGGPGLIKDALLDRVQGNAKVTYLLKALGSHVFKAGIDIERLNYNNVRAYTGGVYLREGTSSTLWQDYRRYGFLSGPDASTNQLTQTANSASTTAGGFIQDSWTIANRVTLNVGVRYDTQWLYGNGGQDLAFVLGNQISPRLGVIVDPMANGRMKVYANFARYYEQVPINLLDRGFPTEQRYVAYRNPGSDKCDATNIDTPEGQRACLSGGNLAQINSYSDLNPSFNFLGGKADATPVDPNIQPQSSDELLFGAEYEVLANTRLGATYTHRSMNSVIEDMSRDGGNTYFLGNPGSGFTKGEFPKATRDYDAVSVFLTRNFTDGWLAQASYTWSRLYGNYAGLFRPENDQLDPNTNSDFDLVELLENRTGLLPYDRTHSVKLFGAKEFNFTNNLTGSLGLSYRGNSGTPISYLGGHPTYGTSEAFILPRGTAGRTPWVHNIDGNIGVNYRVTRTNVLSLSLDVFNIFNFQQYTQVDQIYANEDVLPIKDGIEGELTPDKVTTVAGTPLPADKVNKNFKQATTYQAPRQIRLGLKYTF
ncbi:TonB-dependent receptor plug domain-containing protein [Cystobacter fuscus]|uniref:TonB-dependent receptor n=1 Tax=Cystobacter fuscus TaxID=43 RepID=UPI002B2A4593|nr:TonB-dependent receptor plug domain-containing protein [Cystobacter fuscus]